MANRDDSRACALAASEAVSEAARDSRRGRGRLRVEDARELDAQLISAAREAFSTHGYGATSMAALARTACVSKTTLYAKYPTKAALFRAVIERQLDDAYTAVRTTAEAMPRTLAASLTNLAEQTVRAASEPENLALNRLIEWEAPRFPELAEVLRTRGRIAIEHIASYIDHFAEVDGVPCRDPRSAAAIFNLTVRGLYHDIQVGLRSPDPQELHGMIEKIVTAFLAGRRDW